MTREHFEALVEEAFQAIPREFRRRLKNIVIVVESEPSPALLAEMEIEPPDTLFGLYQGTPLTQRGWDYGNRLPDRIVLFQRPITEGAADEDEIFDTIAETLIHEAGHYFGMSEEQIQAIEEQYLARRDPDDRETIRSRSRRADREGPQAIRAALPRARLGRESHRRHLACARGHVPRDRPGPRRADAAAGRTVPAHRRGRDRSRSRAALPSRRAGRTSRS